MQEYSNLSNKNNNQKSSTPVFAQNRQSFFFKPVQPKLNINQPNDIYEQEADAVADMVMRMTDNESIQQPFFKPPISSIQGKCEHCEIEEKKMQRKESSSQATVAPSTESYISSLSGGRSLNERERNFFEPRLGYDFSNVRLHTDNTADQSAKNLNALAYTHGNDIVFASNQYQPETEAGKRLMAHELTHIVQQGTDANLSRKVVQRYDSPQLWCNQFMDLVRYEDAHGKWGVITHYNSLSNENLIPLNYNIPSIYGEVDVDWMFRLAFIQYPFILTSIITPSMSEGFGNIFSRLGQVGLKTFWNTVRAPSPQWDLEYSSVIEEGNWNSSTAIVAWIHQDLSLRDIFAPAISLC